MKSRHLLVGAVALLALSSSADAQTAPTTATGNVGVTGVVSSMCTLSGSSTQTIPLGELAGSDGHVDTSKSGGPVSFTVTCTTTTPSISISASSLVGETAPPDSSYTNIVGYTAHVKVDEVSSNSETFSVVSQNSASPTATTSSLGHALSGSANDVSVSVDTLTTPTSAVLTQGNYGASNPPGSGGVISITIGPT